jgi:hypothetical protein
MEIITQAIGVFEFETPIICNHGNCKRVLFSTIFLQRFCYSDVAQGAGGKIILYLTKRK